uniref:CCHC-type domain-containing protein n=1 Tax=Macrostomum lignano TaxID=282301 RepID=A0A1I8JIB2_9PLAT
MPALAMIDSNGTVFWPIPTKLRSSCKVDVTYFPFDEQMCDLKFGSWTYDGFQVNLHLLKGDVDTTAYVPNGEWELLGTKAIRNVIRYPCCQEPYPDITFYIFLRRKRKSRRVGRVRETDSQPELRVFRIDWRAAKSEERPRRRLLYYMYHVIYPCIMMSTLTLLVFCLPPDSGEKIALGITVLLAFSVLMLSIADRLPETSESVPLISIYLTVVMSMTSVSVIMTVFVLNLHHRGPSRRPLPDLLRRLLLRPGAASKSGFSGIGGIASAAATAASGGGGGGGGGASNSHGLADLGSTSAFLRNLSLKLTMDSLAQNLQAGAEAEEQQAAGGGAAAGENSIGTAYKPSATGRSNHVALNSYQPLRPTAPAASAAPSTSAPRRPAAAAAANAEVVEALRKIIDKHEADDTEARLIAEWRAVAQFVDKLLFWVYLLCTFASTLIILVIAPVYRIIPYTHREPVARDDFSNATGAAASHRSGRLLAQRVELSISAVVQLEHRAGKDALPVHPQLDDVAQAGRLQPLQADGVPGGGQGGLQAAQAALAVVGDAAGDVLGVENLHCCVCRHGCRSKWKVLALLHCAALYDQKALTTWTLKLQFETKFQWSSVTVLVANRAFWKDIFQPFLTEACSFGCVTPSGGQVEIINCCLEDGRRRKQAARARSAAGRSSSPRSSALKLEKFGELRLHRRSPPQLSSLSPRSRWQRRRSSSAASMADADAWPPPSLPEASRRRNRRSASAGRASSSSRSASSSSASARPEMMNQDFRMMNRDFRMMNRDFRMMNRDFRMMNRDFRMMNRDFRMMNRDFRMMNQDFRMMNQDFRMMNRDFRMMNRDFRMMNRDFRMMNRVPENEDWLQYKERMEQVFIASDIESEDKKRAVFLSVCGKETFKLICSLLAPRKPSETSYADICQKLKEHWKPEPSEIVQRFHFYQRVRASTESVADFLASLRRLAVDCKDRLVLGIQDDRIQRRLLSEPELDLEKALKIAQAVELAAKGCTVVRSSQEVAGPAAAASVDRVDQAKATGFGRAPQKCFRCLSTRHLADKCPFIKKACFKCGKLGHTAAACRRGAGVSGADSKPRVGAVQEAEDEDCSSLNTVPSVAAKVPPYLTTVLINGVSCQMEIDTGAAVSLISAKVYQDLLGGIPKLGGTTIRLRNYGGQPVNVLGQLSVTVEIPGNKQKLLPLVVVSGSGSSLIGTELAVGTNHGLEKHQGAARARIAGSGQSAAEAPAPAEVVLLIDSFNEGPVTAAQHDWRSAEPADDGPASANTAGSGTSGRLGCGHATTGGTEATTRQARQSEVLREGDDVVVRDFTGQQKWLPASISRQTAPLSYECRLPDDRIVRRHADHVASAGVEPRTSGSTELPMNDDLRYESAEAEVPPTQPPTAPPPPTQPPLPPTPQARRSQRNRKCPDRLTYKVMNQDFRMMNRDFRMMNRDFRMMNLDFMMMMNQDFMMMMNRDFSLTIWNFRGTYPPVRAAEHSQLLLPAAVANIAVGGAVLCLVFSFGEQDGQVEGGRWVSEVSGGTVIGGRFGRHAGCSGQQAEVEEGGREKLAADSHIALARSGRPARASATARLVQRRQACSTERARSALLRLLLSHLLPLRPGDRRAVQHALHEAGGGAPGPPPLLQQPLRPEVGQRHEAGSGPGSKPEPPAAEQRCRIRCAKAGCVRTGLLLLLPLLLLALPLLQRHLPELAAALKASLQVVSDVANALSRRSAMAVPTFVYRLEAAFGLVGYLRALCGRRCQQTVQLRFEAAFQVHGKAAFCGAVESAMTQQQLQRMFGANAGSHLHAAWHEGLYAMVWAEDSHCRKVIFGSDCPDSPLCALSTTTDDQFSLDFGLPSRPVVSKVQEEAFYAAMFSNPAVYQLFGTSVCALYDWALAKRGPEAEVECLLGYGSPVSARGIPARRNPRAMDLAGMVSPSIRGIDAVDHHGDCQQVAEDSSGASKKQLQHDLEAAAMLSRPVLLLQASDSQHCVDDIDAISVFADADLPDIDAVDAEDEAEYPPPTDSPETTLSPAAPSELGVSSPLLPPPQPSGVHPPSAHSGSHRQLRQSAPARASMLRCHAEAGGNKIQKRPSWGNFNWHRVSGPPLPKQRFMPPPRPPHPRSRPPPGPPNQWSGPPSQLSGLLLGPPSPPPGPPSQRSSQQPSGRSNSLLSRLGPPPQPSAPPASSRRELLAARLEQAVRCGDFALAVQLATSEEAVKLEILADSGLNRLADQIAQAQTGSFVTAIRALGLLRKPTLNDLAKLESWASHCSAEDLKGCADAAFDLFCKLLPTHLSRDLSWGHIWDGLMRFGHSGNVTEKTFAQCLEAVADGRASAYGDSAAQLVSLMVPELLANSQWITADLLDRLWLELARQGDSNSAHLIGSQRAVVCTGQQQQAAFLTRLTDAVSEIIQRDSGDFKPLCCILDSCGGALDETESLQAALLEALLDCQQQSHQLDRLCRDFKLYCE